MVAMVNKVDGQSASHILAVRMESRKAAHEQLLANVLVY